MSSILIIVFVMMVGNCRMMVKSQSVNFTDCGEGNVKDVRIFPCMENIIINHNNNSICVIELGTNVTVEADFIARKLFSPILLFEYVSIEPKISHHHHDQHHPVSIE
ncbi:hypothetical protein BLA29_009256 [Euroglyphus maynei]|uniref:Uncharacterized protein n=1 Tax=Euroglyphus maynei TaxID=6958 RepID=A0A1Y3AYM4_EURMA|nr:hypothetical protein BLA29_009256 [Euroglyphus maynei]